MVVSATNFLGDVARGIESTLNGNLMQAECMGGILINSSSLLTCLRPLLEIGDLSYNPS